MAMVYGFVKQTAGFVNVYSEVNQGTCIKLYLPEVAEAAETVRSGDKAEPAFQVTGSRKTVLIVEDDQHVRKIASSLVENLGFRVLEAEDGPSAIAIFDKTGDIELVFTDMVMPGPMNGVELVQKLREHRPGLKAVIASGYNKNVASPRESGIIWIRKPYTREVLAEKLLAILEEREANAEKTASDHR